MDSPRLERMDLRPAARKGFRTGASLAEPKTIPRNWPSQEQTGATFYDVTVTFQSNTLMSYSTVVTEHSIHKKKGWMKVLDASVEEDETGFNPHAVIPIKATPGRPVSIARQAERHAVTLRGQWCKEEKDGSDEEDPAPKAVVVKGRKGRTLKTVRPKGKKGCRKAENTVEPTEKDEDEFFEVDDEENTSRKRKHRRNSPPRVSKSEGEEMQTIRIRVVPTEAFVKKGMKTSQLKGGSLDFWCYVDTPSRQRKMTDALLMNTFV